MTDHASACPSPVPRPWHAAGRAARAFLSRGQALAAALLLAHVVAFGGVGHAAAGEPQALSRAACAPHASAEIGGAAVVATHADAAAASLPQPAGHDPGGRGGPDAETVEEVAVPAASVASLAGVRGPPIRQRAARSPLLVLPLPGRPPNG